MSKDVAPQDVSTEDLTQLLIDWSDGDKEALARLMPLVYNELHRLAERYMRRERQDHTLQPTALVHEAYLRLIDQNRVQWRNRAHFFGVAAQLMRRVTLHHVRHLKAAKRGGAARRVSFDEGLWVSERRASDLLELDRALDRLASLEPRTARVVELRFFGGLTVQEAAEVLGISARTVKREWRLARAWLGDHLRGDGVAAAAVPAAGTA
ncbi:MAG: sigma-70 family RNA polymerase sigma factor [Acidobacteriota bacterium]